MDLQHPTALWNFDMGGARTNSYVQALECVRQGSKRGWPDIFIAEPHGGYHGLFIELKRTGERLYKKNGEPVTSSKDRIAIQSHILAELESRGYKATFAIGFDEAKKITDDYLSLYISS